MEAWLGTLMNKLVREEGGELCQFLSNVFFGLASCDRPFGLRWPSQAGYLCHSGKLGI